MLFRWNHRRINYVQKLFNKCAFIYLFIRFQKYKGKNRRQTKMIAFVAYVLFGQIVWIACNISNKKQNRRSPVKQIQ